MSIQNDWLYILFLKGPLHQIHRWLLFMNKTCILQNLGKYKSGLFRYYCDTFQLPPVKNMLFLLLSVGITVAEHLWCLTVNPKIMGLNLGGSAIPLSCALREDTLPNKFHIHPGEVNNSLLNTMTTKNMLQPYNQLLDSGKHNQSAMTIL